MRETFVVNDLQTLRNVHPRDECLGDSCTIHRPSEHHMRDWRLWWCDDRYLLDRICPHGRRHPDPDTLALMLTLGGGEHACDGCCLPPAPTGDRDPAGAA